ncbi:hypothetical protein, partial [Dokdonella sp.]|uniref:hypothetical protein n=1 Tax=Dokdonella sp. TaxID=2291710 RepID=UPI0027BAA579
MAGGLPFPGVALVCTNKEKEPARRAAGRTHQGRESVVAIRDQNLAITTHTQWSATSVPCGLPASS